MDDRFCLGVGERELFERGYFARQAPEVLPKAQYRGQEFASQLKAGSMFPVQRDQVSSETQVGTDKDREPGTDLDGHGLVVRGPEAESSDAIRRILIRKLQNTEQGRAIAPQCKLLFTDGDLVLTQYLVQSIDELDVRYGLEGTCRVWRFHQSQLFPGDQISVDVGQKLTVFMSFSLFLWWSGSCSVRNNGRKKVTMRPKQYKICKELA